MDNRNNYYHRYYIRFIVLVLMVVGIIIFFLDCNCGIPNLPSGNRIFGGQEAVPHKFPWNVYILFQKNGPDGPKWYSCGGALLDQVRKWTISAWCNQLEKLEAAKAA